MDIKESQGKPMKDITKELQLQEEIVELNRVIEIINHTNTGLTKAIDLAREEINVLKTQLKESKFEVKVKDSALNLMVEARTCGEHSGWLLCNTFCKNFDCVEACKNKAKTELLEERTLNKEDPLK